MTPRSIANIISHIPWIWPFLQVIPNADTPLEAPRKVYKGLVSKRMKAKNTMQRDLYYYLVKSALCHMTACP